MRDVRGDSACVTTCVLAVLGTACGLVDSGDDGPDERVMPGIVGLSLAETIRVPDSARVGEDLAVTVYTEVRGGCGGYGVTGPHETQVQVDGLQVEVRPFDVIQRTAPPPSNAACTLELRLIPHEVVVVPRGPGTLRILAVGRRLDPGQRVIDRGEPVTHEVTVEVQR